MYWWHPESLGLIGPSVWEEFARKPFINRLRGQLKPAARSDFARVGSIPGVWVSRSRLFCNFSGVGVGVTPFPKRVISRRLCDFHDKLCTLHDGLREMMMLRNLLCKSIFMFNSSTASQPSGWIATSQFSLNFSSEMSMSRGPSAVKRTFWDPLYTQCVS